MAGKGEKILDEKYNSIKSDEYCSEKEGYEKTGYIISEKTKNGIIYGAAYTENFEVSSPACFSSL